MSLGVRLLQPFRWAFASILQPLLVIAAVAYALVTADGDLALLSGWCLFLFFHVPAIIANRQIHKALSSMDIAALESWSRLLPWLNWGPPGQFWQDVYMSYALFAQEKYEEALALLSKWENARDLPRPLASVIPQYRLFGEALLWHWQEVVDGFEKLRFGRTKAAPMLYLIACRGYLELGQMHKAGECLKQAHFDESIYPLDSLAVNLLPYFALNGERVYVDRIISVINQTNSHFPQALKLLWLGRCLQREGLAQEASESLVKAKELAPTPLVAKRIEQAMAASCSRVEPDSQVPDIWRLFKRAAFIQEILSPRRKSPIVNCLIIANILVFISSQSFLNALGINIDTPISAYNFGTSYQAVIEKGQYWRLLTYLFYHNDILHIGSNLVGLYVFGRIAENIFGSTRFLGIYFVGGVLSGLAHDFLSPHQLAVGASGAIQAVFAACAAGIYKLRDTLPASLRGRYLGFMSGIAIFQTVLDRFIPAIAGFAHLGGLISGLALGFVTAGRNPDSLDSLDIDGTQKFVDG